MAYCKNCGAYIPDELSACLACGFDENAARASAAAQKAKAEKAQEDEDMREILERHRRLQQEKNRQWAEKEQERREKEKENRRWAQEEYARRQAQREVEEEQRAKEERDSRRWEEMREEARSYQSSRQTGTGNTALAALSYLSIFFTLPFLFAPEDQYARYHAKQGLRLFLFSAIADIIGGLTGIGWVLSIFRIYCIYKGITNALQGKKEPLPYIGTIGKEP